MRSMEIDEFIGVCALGVLGNHKKLPLLFKFSFVVEAKRASDGEA